MEVPRPGTEYETQLQPVPQMWQHRILNLLRWGSNLQWSKQQQRQCWILNLRHHSGNSQTYKLFSLQTHWKARGQIGAAAASLYHSPQPWQHQTRAESATHITTCGNTGSLIHWARPEIEPASSPTLPWVLNPLSHHRSLNLQTFDGPYLPNADLWHLVWRLFPPWTPENLRILRVNLFEKSTKAFCLNQVPPPILLHNLLQQKLQGIKRQQKIKREPWFKG